LAKGAKGIALRSDHSVAYEIMNGIFGRSLGYAFVWHPQAAALTDSTPCDRTLTIRAKVRPSRREWRLVGRNIL
jgi:hypothetical protein